MVWNWMKANLDGHLQAGFWQYVEEGDQSCFDWFYFHKSLSRRRWGFSDCWDLSCLFAERVANGLAGLMILLGQYKFLKPFCRYTIINAQNLSAIWESHRCVLIRTYMSKENQSGRIGQFSSIIVKSSASNKVKPFVRQCLLIVNFPYLH